MKAFNTLITIVLVLSFIMGVYCAGTSMTYDFRKHLESISTVAEEMPTFEDLGSIWTVDVIENGNMGAGPAGSTRATVNIQSWPTIGPFAAVRGENDAIWYPFVKRGIQGGTDAALEFLQPISNFFDGTLELCGRVVYTFVWTGDYIIGFFKLVWKVIPTSGLVERGAY